MPQRQIGVDTFLMRETSSTVLPAQPAKFIHYTVQIESSTPDKNSATLHSCLNLMSFLFHHLESSFTSTGLRILCILPNSDLSTVLPTHRPTTSSVPSLDFLRGITFKTMKKIFSSLLPHQFGQTFSSFIFSTSLSGEVQSFSYPSPLVCPAAVMKRFLRSVNLSTQYFDPNPRHCNLLSGPKQLPSR